MPLMFNSILREAGIPLSDVRLLRHKDQRAKKGRAIYELWRDDRPQFEAYQSTQGFPGRKKLQVPHWASFVGTPSDETLFVGIYEVEYLGLIEKDTPMPHTDGVLKAGSCDAYRLTLDPRFADLDGKLFIDWGPSPRAWVQRPDRQNKRITQLHTTFKEPDFPGFLNFLSPLSKLDSLPPA